MRAAVLFLLAFTALDARPPIRAKDYLAHVKHLSSPEMRGRGTGSPELDKAAAYIAGQFLKAGLRPAGGDGYYQSFPVSVGSMLGEANRLSYSVGGDRRELAIDADYIPMSFSGSGTVSAPVVFAGYGITAREYGYDDYAGVDARGRIAVLLAHEPQEYETASVFEGRIYTEHSQLFSKALNARAHGAAAVIYVSDTANHSSAEKLEAFISTVSPANPGMPFLHVRSEVVERWFAAAGRDFKQLQSAIDREGRPQSFAFPDTLRVEMETDVRHRPQDVKNVVGFLPGQTEEYVILGAHYDHLGLGEQYSLAPEKAGTPHPGADDNASGTAGLVSLAHHLARGPKPRRGVLFVAFAGEEIGLLGSSFYVSHPLLPLERARVMINMDMIGRIRESRVMVGGAGAQSPFRPVLERLQRRHALKLDLDDGGVYGSSDHTSFLTRLVPVLFFFSGLHSDYHRPSDTWEKIEAAGAARLLALIADFIASGVSAEPVPKFTTTAGAGTPTGN